MNKYKDILLENIDDNFSYFPEGNTIDVRIYTDSNNFQIIGKIYEGYYEGGIFLEDIILLDFDTEDTLGGFSKVLLTLKLYIDDEEDDSYNENIIEAYLEALSQEEMRDIIKEIIDTQIS